MAAVLEFEMANEVDVPHWVSIAEEEELERVLHPAAKGSSSMEDVDALKAQVKKLNARAMEVRMALHDLSEELPAGLERVMEVAQQTVDAFNALDAARKQLNAATK